MKITSTHIKIVKLIKKANEIEFVDLASALELGRTTLRNHLIKLESYLETDRKDLSLKEIIDEIHDDNKILYKIRKDQTFKKDEKMYYLAFLFLTEDIVKLTNKTKELAKERRTIGKYTQEVRELFKEYNLILIGTRNGVKVVGGSYTKTRLLFIILFKIKLEKHFLPREFRRAYIEYVLKTNFRKNKNFRLGYKKICEEFSKVVSEYAIQVLSNVYLALKVNKVNTPIIKLEEEKLLKYKPNGLEKDKFFRVMNRIKETPLGEIDIIYLDYIFINISYCTLTNKNFPKEVIKRTLIIKPYILKYLELKEMNTTNYIRMVAPWVSYSIMREKFNMFDFSYILIGLSIPETEEMTQAVKKIKKYIPVFSKYELLFFRYILKEQREKDKEIIFVYDKLPKRLVFEIVEKIEKAQNLKIKKIVNKKNIYNLEKKIDEIITVEKIKIKKNIKVTMLEIPI